MLADSTPRNGVSALVDFLYNVAAVDSRRKTSREEHLQTASPQPVGEAVCAVDAYVTAEPKRTPGGLVVNGGYGLLRRARSRQHDRHHRVYPRLPTRDR